MKTATTAEQPINTALIRKDFPILSMQVHGHPLSYLDNAATTQKPQAVLDALNDYYTSKNSNVHRSLHYLSEQATVGYENARTTVAGFINAPNDQHLVFTRGTTESINLVAHSWGRANVGHDDEIILSEIEHHSNMVPWQMLAKERRARLLYIPMQEDGSLDLDAYKGLLSEKTKLVAVTHQSNVLGTINPIKAMVEAAHAAGAKVLVDGAQSVPHMPVDVVDLGCDFLAFSAHKMLGPTGIGALYAAGDALEEMEPYQGGGEMILKVEWHQATWNEVPHKFEAGTPNIAGAIGFAAGIDYLTAMGMDAVRAHEVELTAYLVETLQSIPGLRIHGQAAERGGAVSFEMEHIHPHDLTQFVDRKGVAIRAGHMCAQPLMRKLNVGALSRASLYLYNERNDVDQLIDSLHEARSFFDV